MAKPSRPAPGLEEISTRWPLIKDPTQFVLRYAPAIQKYLEALLRNDHDAEEVTQDFLLKGLLRGFVRTPELRGRFRDYLKAAVRNTALNHLERHRRAPGAALPAGGPAAREGPGPADQEWAEQWRRCILDRVWQALEHHEQQHRQAGNLGYTALRLTVDHPEEDSPALAARAAALTGRPLRADAFRKQLSRARVLFAESLVAEVAQTLERPSADEVEEELIEVGLMPYVRAFLPPDWKSRLDLRRR
jgi:hypothetical protein